MIEILVYIGIGFSVSALSYIVSNRENLRQLKEDVELLKKKMKTETDYLKIETNFLRSKLIEQNTKINTNINETDKRIYTIRE